MVFVSLESSLLNSVLVRWGIFNQNFGWISIYAANCIYQLFCSLTSAGVIGYLTTKLGGYNGKDSIANSVAVRERRLDTLLV